MANGGFHVGRVPHLTRRYMLLFYTEKIL